MQLSRVAVLLLFLFVAQCLLAGASEEKKQRRRRKGKGQDKEQPQDGATARKAESSPSGAEQGKRQGKGSVPQQGRFVNKDKAHCKWRLRGEDGADRNLRVECKKGADDYWCEFTGKPSACAKYAGDAKTYWKQITRALKKQKAICSEPSAVLKSSLCRSTKAANLKMTGSTQQTAAAPGKEQPKLPSSLSTVDPDAPDIDKVASEYCSESWGSVCKFMLSAMQG